MVASPLPESPVRHDAEAAIGDLGGAEPWLRAVGLVIWGFIGVSRLLTEATTDLRGRIWLAPWLVFGAAMALAGPGARLPQRVRIGLLATQTAAVVAFTALGLRGSEGLMLSIVGVQAPMVMTLRRSLFWTLAQLPLLLALVVPFKRPLEILEILGAYSTFSAFALVVYRLHQQEMTVRRALARANAELVATRALVVDGARQGERLRISRELHDSLGHHLTALGIQLELAQALSSGPVGEPVGRARVVAKEALAEVRRVAAAVKRSDGLDLVAALEALAAGIPNPRIVVAAPASLPADDPARTHALFRCVQEAITNSLRHAGARAIHVDLALRDGRYAVIVRDDGRGARQLVEGAGLAGMRARVAELGGALEIRTAPGDGFEIALWAPAPRGGTPGSP